MTNDPRRRPPESNVQGEGNGIYRLFEECLAQAASDLHLTAGSPPMLRIEGTLVPLASQPTLTQEQMQRYADELLPGISVDWSKGSVDGATTGPGASRFRFNVFRRQGGLSIALRRLEDRFRSLEELGLPASLYSLCDLRDGLVLVCGPTGAGKSTTLATLIDRINRTRACHIVTIEDPIEYLHKPAMSLVNQRQVGLDAPSFHDAMVASLRQDPDVVLVGEIRDLGTIRTAITAAETGHLVLTSVHAGDCVGAIERLVAVFPEGEQEGVRRQLALVLRAAVAQHLLPSCGPTGERTRAASSEVLMVTSAVANLIASGRTSQIYSLMESGQAAGMQTLEQDLARLWVDGRISEQAAVACARNVGILRDRAALLRGKPRHARETKGDHS